MRSEANIRKEPAAPTKKRFRVALSFPGEHRTFISEVAADLSLQLGKDRVFYDKYYEAELARPNLDTYLQGIYRNDSDLVVVFLCADYTRKKWCGLEWRAFRDLIAEKQDSAIMPFRFDDTQVPGLFSIDGYVSVKERAPEEIANLILERLALDDVSDSSVEPAAVRMEQSVVVSSGNWVMLDSRFFQAAEVKVHASRKVSVRIVARNAEDDAELRSLSPNRFGRSEPIAFAHGNDALIGRVRRTESQSTSNGNLWTIELEPEDVQYGGSFMSDVATPGYSADDIAKLRAGRILLNDPAPPGPYSANVTREHVTSSTLETLIAGLNLPVRVTECPIKKLYADMKSDSNRFLEISRLPAIFFLKAGGVVEHILELSFGPLKEGKLHVRFRGKRRQAYINKEATIIEIEGDCRLE